MKFRAATIALLAVGLAAHLSCPALRAVTFTNNSRIQISDSTQSLTWNSDVGALSVLCWFKLSVPTGVIPPDYMTILVNPSGSSTNEAHAYNIYFNHLNGNVEFTARGDAGLYRRTLIERPYLDRWYHVAISRAGNSFSAFVDGRLLPDSGASGTAGETTGATSVSIGGWGNGNYLWGEVQEVGIYHSVLQGSDIRLAMFSDQRTNDNIRGYFKLGASTNAADHLRNFAPAAALDTDPAIASPGKQFLAFDETDQAGEQSAYDSRKNKGMDVIVPLSGAFSWSQTLLARPTPGVAFDFQLGYSSAIPQAGGSGDAFDKRTLGPGWRHTFDARLIRGESSSVLNLITWDGGLEVWDRSPTNTSLFFTRHKEYRGEILKINDGSDDHEWITPQRIIYRFRNPSSGNENIDGRLVEIRDFNANKLRLVWNEALGRLLRVSDTAGGQYVFNYNTARQLLTNVSFREWSINFFYETNRLVAKSITNSSALYSNINTSWQFRYSNPSNGTLNAIIDPRGNTNIFVQYDQYGRKTNETDALGRATQTRYGLPGKRQITHIDPGTNSWIETYDRKGRITARQDPLTNVTRFTYDDRGNRTSMIEPLGRATLFHHDDRANVIARTNALGEITRWNFHPFFNKATDEINPLGWVNNYEYDTRGNLLRHYDAIGDLVRYDYLSNGLVSASIDANGNTNRLGYDTNGFLIRRTDAAGFSTTFGYNDLGWKGAETNALSHATTYFHDLNGNVVRVVDPLQRVFVKTFDANGNMTSESDGKGQITTHAYDAANQKTNTVDRTRTNTWTYSYTSRGKLEIATDPLGHSITNLYDPANRLVKISDPLGQSVQREYDANGNELAMIDQVNQRWTKTYDRLNRVRAETDPLNNTRETTYDPAGRIKQVFTPNGFPSTHEYDGRGRLTNWVDAENFPWRYFYDGNANITNITDALGGHYIMAYSNRNERVFEQNQDTNIWRYAYDPLLRLAVQQDPNGTTRTLEYDRAGRLRYARFNTGRINSLSYDQNNNITELERIAPGSYIASTLDYDAMDRLTSYFDDVTFYDVLYGRDALGRISSVTYPAGKLLTQRFDPVGRLTNQVFRFDSSRSFTNTYAYDNAGRLTARSYPNGVVQSNAFDNAGRITGLSYRPSQTESNRVNIALTYAYDRNGNKTGGAEKGTLDWPVPALTDELANYTSAGKLETRSITTGASPTGLWSYHYDTSGNMTNAHNGPESYRLAYDEDNRTTSILYSASTNVSIVNRYDALGRRVSRILNNTETLYVLDVSGDMERILCELDENDAITGWYVHGPDLAFKVDATGDLTCYHADAQANIIATTGASGTLLAQYAFTPYGRLLGSQLSTNNPQLLGNSQPFLFVGSQGVMQELPGLYFMRARYYSANAGVFLSTDPVKKIGSGWKPQVSAYAGGNPLRSVDPNGEDFFQIQFKSSTQFGVHGCFGGPGRSACNWKTFEDVPSLLAAASENPPIDSEDWGYFVHDLVAVAMQDKALVTRTVVNGVADTLLGASLYARSLVGDPSDNARQRLYAMAFSGPAQVFNTIGYAKDSIQRSSPVLGPNGPHANSTPITIGVPQTSNGGSQSMSSRTASIGAPYGSAVTTATSTRSTAPSNQSGNTTSAGGNSASHGNRGSGTQSFINPVRPPPPPPPTLFQRIKNFFGRLGR